MHRFMLPAVVLAGITLAPAAGYPEAPLELKSVSVSLPFGDKMFPGPGSDAINQNCLACHSADMVLNQFGLDGGSRQDDQQLQGTGGACRRPRDHRLPDGHQRRTVTLGERPC